MERAQPFSQWYVKSISVFLISSASLLLGWAANQKQPDGATVLMRMADYIAKSPAWSVTIHTAYDAVQPDGFKVEWNGVRTVTLKRPDRLRVESESSDGARSLVLFDGKTITTFDESARVYAQEPHPGSLDDAVVYFVHDLGMRLPLALMLVDRLPAELQKRIQAVKYAEKTQTLGIPADHIAAKTPTVDFQLWIAEGDRPLPLRIVLTYKNTGVNRIPFAATLSSIAPAHLQIVASKQVCAVASDRVQMSSWCSRFGSCSNCRGDAIGLLNRVLQVAAISSRHSA